ncbi:AarF/UbiB family protein [Sphingorhabdus sp. YGSMI21]|uniref:AarF/UbiB family protein n=2 Tax=Sphingomonadaceae TaxID=41297 RepID=UPI001F0BB79F|nr:AarF/UbiB family protein [Sphingorhabdus sp. YGSMI21]
MNLGNALGIAPFPEEDVSPEHLRPKSMVALLRDIGPIGVKLGQLLATRGDVFSDEWIDALASLQDRVEPLPFDAIEPVLVASWGEKWEEDFTAFERDPMASASIAQTYTATLLNSSDVIVKVRRSGTAARLEADMRILVRLAKLSERRSSDIARYRPVEFLQTFGKNLAR